MYILDLQLFSEESGVEEVPAAEEQQISENPEKGVEETQAAAEPEETEDKTEVAFAKRLSAEREKIEKEYSEKYKDFEVYQKATEYLQKQSGLSDLMSLKEQIELAELQDRAKEQNISPEVQKRLDDLEAKAAKADELERERQEQEYVTEFQRSLEEFVKDKGVEAEEVWTYMIEHGLPYNPETADKHFSVAIKAMKADELEAKLTTAKEDAVKEYLKSKQAPRTGDGAVADPPTPRVGGFKGAEQRALERLRASRSPE